MEDEVLFDDVPLNEGDLYDLEWYDHEMWICDQMSAYENMMGKIQQEYQELQELGALWEEADMLAEMEEYFSMESISDNYDWAESW